MAWQTRLINPDKNWLISYDNLKKAISCEQEIDGETNGGTSITTVLNIEIGLITFPKRYNL